MKKTWIRKYWEEDRDKWTQPVKRVEIREKAYKHPTYFARNMLGMEQIQVFQHLIFSEMSRNNKRVAICSSRQIGKSVALAVVAIWAAYFNLFPSGKTKYEKATKVIIISKDERASVKLMGEIRNTLHSGDAYFSMLTEGKYANHFTGRLATGRKDPDNKTQITFKPRDGSSVGSTIKCYPPTDAVRGESADILIIDEAGYVDDETYRDSIKPTVATTGGFIILSSTPKGQKGFFYDVFDPFEKYDNHEFTRFWFPWTVCELEGQRKVVEMEKFYAQQRGTIKGFMQEYEADFTVDQDAFFSLAKVDEAIDENAVEQYEWKKSPCAMGIDYGMTSCNTVITITTKLPSGKIALLYQHEFELGFDDNLLMETSEIGENSIPSLMKRFKIEWIVPDQCAQGWATNNKMASMGLPVMMDGDRIGFNFRSDQADRNRSYVALKSALNAGKIRIPNIPELIAEMKTLESVDNKIYTSIRKGKGGSDDRIDSFMMSTVPFLVMEEEAGFDVEIQSYDFQEAAREPSVREDLGLRKFEKNLVKAGKDAYEEARIIKEELRLWR